MLFRSRAEPNCLLSPSCRLKGALQTALQAFLAALDEVTLADLIVNQPRLRDMLGVIALTPAP